MNRYLLDTHTLIWFLNDTGQLPSSVVKILKDPSDRCFVSIVTLWEMAIKLNIGKLFLQIPYSELRGFCVTNGFEPLMLAHEHCEAYCCPSTTATRSTVS